MSRLERLSNRFLRVGRHPFKACIKVDTLNDEVITCCCCTSDSTAYSRFWPFIFCFSALTDFPLPLPKDKKPGQHRDWGWLPVMIISGIFIYLYYGYVDRIVRKSIFK